MITVEQIRRIVLTLPGAYEHASHGGMPSWRTKPRGFAWLRVNPEALALCVDSLDTKNALLAAEPELFFTTPHYDGIAMVLVHMDCVSVTRAKALLTEAWRVRAAKAPVAKKPTAKKRAKPAAK
jgi:hypothetical protein